MAERPPCTVRHMTLDVPRMVIGTRRGTKYTHPVRVNRYVVHCPACGWSSGLCLSLGQARNVAHEHAEAGGGGSDG